MVSRERIIAAAASVYAAHGFRGATTRRIAEAAGVNEITLFRQFGSKEALINEALRQLGANPHGLPSLPEAPLDPQGELTAWCEAHLEFLRANRSMIRKTMSEIEERPEAGSCSVKPNRSAAAELMRYTHTLLVRGFVPRVPRVPRHPVRDASREELAHAAVAMLMASLFGDAMGRDMMPDMYPQPAAGAAALYVRLFLRSLGIPDAARAAVPALSRRRRDAAGEAQSAAPNPAPRRRRTDAPTASGHHPTTQHTRQ